MGSWHSYPKIYNVGHAALAGYFDHPVIVEEKVDGSQFSFGLIDGVLRARSKGQELVLDAPEKMFSLAIGQIREIQHDLHPGWTYRAEYLQKPHHNGLAYERTPARNLIVFDVNTEEECYLPYDEKAEEARRLGMEVVPKVFEGIITDAEHFRALLETVSILGGQKIEGVVCKHYKLFGPDKKALLAKFVSEEFKEVQARVWTRENPTVGDIVEQLGQTYRAEARWNKAIQRMREDGTLANSPTDIGSLMKLVQKDIQEECRQEIEAALFAFAWKQISRKAVAGLPEWYKQRLIESQFAKETA